MGKRMPTALAEKVYSVLTRFADADSSYHEKESFIFHFGVCSDISMTYNLKCQDGNSRKFTCVEGKMWVQGKGESRVNSILKKILEEDTEMVLKFKEMSDVS